MDFSLFPARTDLVGRWVHCDLCFRCLNTWIRSDEGLTLETSAFRISVRWPIYIINSVDKTKFQMRLRLSYCVKCLENYVKSKPGERRRMPLMISPLLSFCSNFYYELSRLAEAPWFSPCLARKKGKLCPDHLAALSRMRDVTSIHRHFHSFAIGQMLKFKLVVAGFKPLKSLIIRPEFWTTSKGSVQRSSFLLARERNQVNLLTVFINGGQ